jgi:hypothetical protein
MSYRERVYKYSDRKSALAAVALYGHALQEVSPPLLNDRAIILAAVKKNGGVITTSSSPSSISPKNLHNLFFFINLCVFFFDVSVVTRLFVGICSRTHEG